MTESQKDILLYWSGEADAQTVLRVKKLIERDAEARAYLKELDELQTAAATERHNGSRAIQPRRESLLDDVLAEFHESPERSKEVRLSSWRLHPRLVAEIAAVVAVVAGATFLLTRSSDSVRDVATNGPPPHKEPAGPVTLSERLLTRSSSFRTSEGGLEVLRSNRERRGKLRTSKIKS